MRQKRFPERKNGQLLHRTQIMNQSIIKQKDVEKMKYLAILIGGKINKHEKTNHSEFAYQILLKCRETRIWVIYS